MNKHQVNQECQKNGWDLHRIDKFTWGIFGKKGVLVSKGKTAYDALKETYTGHRIKHDGQEWYGEFQGKSRK